MHIRRSVACSVVVSCLTWLVSPAYSQEKKDEAKPAEMSAEDKAWMDAGTPGENHKLLEHFVGDWEVATTMFVGPEPTKGKAKASHTWALGNRYVTEHFQGELMGMPFEGMGVSGYDNIKKKFVGGWVDSMSTGLFTHEGTYDPAKKEFTFIGEFPSPMGTMIKSRMVTVINGPDQHTVTMYHAEKDKPEQKVMEMVYTRAKGNAKPAGGY